MSSGSLRRRTHPPRPSVSASPTTVGEVSAALTVTTEAEQAEVTPIAESPEDPPDSADSRPRHRPLVGTSPCKGVERGARNSPPGGGSPTGSPNCGIAVRQPRGRRGPSDSGGRLVEDEQRRTNSGGPPSRRVAETNKVAEPAVEPGGHPSRRAAERHPSRRAAERPPSRRAAERHPSRRAAERHPGRRAVEGREARPLHEAQWAQLARGSRCPRQIQRGQLTLRPRHLP